ncbi:hypothetical protein PVT67_04645 [Gallaecimonas kandeliae]|uniref:hypothetical protein n=1 Tax=Gallaecimonas kandeliae TaxID=3029055 RepID=UPI00264A317C|nr:hypothetical protein [Gallaecimonas kandeliae]WKE66543.1 hypothetical protein PVT67_04645 [Gallaecimonas kandeliae]
MQLDNLARELKASAAAGRWAQVAEQDRQVAALLAALKPAPAELAQALVALQLVHGQVLAQALQHQARLEQQLAKHRDNQEGMRAYHQMEEMG